MSFNINEFSSQIADNGLLRTNKFLARFPVPNGLLNFQSDTYEPTETARFLEYWCEAAQIPSLILATHPITRYGYGTQENKPFLNQVQNMNFTFISDGGGSIWRFFYTWMNLIINTRLATGIQTSINNQTPYEISYKSDYCSDIEVIAFNDIQQPVLTVVLKEAYPVFLGEINLNWAEKNNIVKFPVTFTTESWGVVATS